MSTSDLLLVRHGESTWNTIRRWQGQADPPLSDRGVDQALRAAATVVAHGPFEAVATSSLERARRTGAIIARELDIELLDAEVDLSERSAGEWEGLTRQEIERRYPGFLVSGRRPAGYETDASIVARSSAALARLGRAHPGVSVLVVSHGGIINALERAGSHENEWARLDNLTGRWFEVADGAVTPRGSRVPLIEDGGPVTHPPGDGAYA